MTTSPQYLQNCQITHTAIRTAFVSTLDALLHFALDPDSATNRPMGFMSCFPILNGTAPQIQMECLFRTWQRVSQGLLDQSDPLDQLVLYASYESLAQITGETHSPLLKVVLNGPGRCFPECDHWLHSKTRCLQISRSGATSSEFLRELSQIEDTSPSLNPEMSKNCCETREELLELVGRWVAQKEHLLGSVGLLTQDEQDILRVFFEEHPGLVR